MLFKDVDIDYRTPLKKRIVKYILLAIILVSGFLIMDDQVFIRFFSFNTIVKIYWDDFIIMFAWPLLVLLLAFKPEKTGAKFAVFASYFILEVLVMIYFLSQFNDYTGIAYRYLFAMLTQVSYFIGFLMLFFRDKTVNPYIMVLFNLIVITFTFFFSLNNPTYAEIVWMLLWSTRIMLTNSLVLAAAYYSFLMIPVVLFLLNYPPKKENL